MHRSGSMANRRFLVLLIATLGFLFTVSILFSHTSTQSAVFNNSQIHPVSVDKAVLKGDAIMGKIGNETLK